MQNCGRTWWQPITVFSLGSKSLVHSADCGATRSLSRREEVSSFRDQIRARRGVTLQSVDSVLPFVELTIDGPEVIHALRSLPFVDYVKPACLYINAELELQQRLLQGTR
jgi:hypothetical protein